MSTFSPQRFVMPAEWAPHESVWLAWPSDTSLWEDKLTAAQEEFVALCEGIADVDAQTSKVRGDKLNILIHPDFSDQQELAQKRLAHLPAQFHKIPFGDIWLRDTAPLFLQNAKGEIHALQMSFNSWGNKYDLPYDPEVAAEIAKASGFSTKKIPWISEGGSLEFDGEGTCLTSEQCLLADNRNPDLSILEIENIICENFGVEKVIWVTDGLLNDHTDGHIDTIVRYVSPGVVLVMATEDKKDPNYALLKNLHSELSELEDARGRKLQIGLVPSPGAVLSEDVEVMPASYLNFYISNSTVVVPTYGQPQDEAAVKAIAKYFPNHRTIGRSALAILAGGGAFHCITQQQPRAKK